jgi:hypothetical protein
MVVEIEDDIPLRRLSPASEEDDGSEQSHLLSDDPDHPVIDETTEISIPPQDRSAGAWKVLLGCWLLEISWGAYRTPNSSPSFQITFESGLPLSFGVFQSYYSQHPLFSSSRSIPTIGALALELPYLVLPLTTPLCLRYAK